MTRGFECHRKKYVYSGMVSVITKAFTFLCMPCYVNYSREQLAMSWPVIINLIFCEVFFLSDTGNLTEPHQLTSFFLFMLENDFVILLLFGMFCHLPEEEEDGEGGGGSHTGRVCGPRPFSKCNFLKLNNN